MKFVVDTKLGDLINVEEDQNVIQKELDDFDDWSNRNGMTFSSSECKAMNLGTNNI